MSDEMINRVDENGNVLGTHPRLEFDANLDWIRPLAHGWLFNPDGQVLLQLTSDNSWDMSCGGHIRADELPKKAIERETMEEIGVSGIDFLGAGTLFRDRTKRQFVYLYYGFIDRDVEEFNLQEQEVLKVEWFDINEAVKMYYEQREREIRVSSKIADELIKVYQSAFRYLGLLIR